jgi:nucleoside-diphosphate-sugar epimerase
MLIPSELEDVIAGFPPSRCLVTGGAGFIGSNLTRALLAAGCEVTVIDDLSVGKREHLPDDAHLQFVRADLRRLDDLPRLVRSADYVFHLAAQVGNVLSLERTGRDAEVNILGSLRLFEACRDTDVRKVVYSSSSATFGEAEALPIAENHVQRPASFYALSKLTAERYAGLAAELWRVPAISLRYFNVYGLPMEESEYTGVISIFFNRLLAGADLTVYGDGEAVRDFVHVGDVVQANLRAALAGHPGREYNIGSGMATTVRMLTELIPQIVGREATVTYRDARAGEVRRSLADITLARRELGYEPRYDLRRGIAEMWQSLSV